MAFMGEELITAGERITTVLQTTGGWGLFVGACFVIWRMAKKIDQLNDKLLQVATDLTAVTTENTIVSKQQAELLQKVIDSIHDLRRG